MIIVVLKERVALEHLICRLSLGKISQDLEVGRFLVGRIFANILGQPRLNDSGASYYIAAVQRFILSQGVDVCHVIEELKLIRIFTPGV